MPIQCCGKKSGRSTTAVFKAVMPPNSGVFVSPSPPSCPEQARNVLKSIVVRTNSQGIHYPQRWLTSGIVALPAMLLVVGTWYWFNSNQSRFLPNQIKTTLAPFFEALGNGLAMDENTAELLSFILPVSFQFSSSTPILTCIPIIAGINLLMNLAQLIQLCRHRNKMDRQKTFEMCARTIGHTAFTLVAAGGIAFCALAINRIAPSIPVTSAASESAIEAAKTGMITVNGTAQTCQTYYDNQASVSSKVIGLFCWFHTTINGVTSAARSCSRNCSGPSVIVSFTAGAFSTALGGIISKCLGRGRAQRNAAKQVRLMPPELNTEYGTLATKRGDGTSSSTSPRPGQGGGASA